MTPAATAMKFDCDICGAKHDLPLALGFSIPDYVNKLLPWEREKECKISEDWCMVADQYFYLRGCLLVPIQGTDEKFSFGVWTTLSEDDFDATMEMWNDPARQNEPPYVGALANSLPLYSETRNLALKVQTQAVGDRPLLIVEQKNHELFADQRNGMTMERAIALSKLVIHGQADNPWSHLCER